MTLQWVLQHLPDEYKDENKVEAGKLGAKARADLAKQHLAKTDTVPPELVYDPTIDERKKYIDGLKLFLPPSKPVIMGLVKYCMEKRVYWQDLVEQALTEFLKKKGYLK
jgi:hypothetical protein